MKFPKIVYKYRDWSNPKHRRTLINNELYLASPKEFNDPFDCRISPDFSLLTPQEEKEYVNDMAISGFQESERQGKYFPDVIRNFEKRLANKTEFQKQADSLLFETQDIYYGIFSCCKKWDNIRPTKNLTNAEDSTSIKLELQKFSPLLNYLLMKELKIKNHTTGRREFLTKLSAAAALGLIGAAGVKGVSAADQTSDSGKPESAMPTITLGSHRISRLICGSNPILGYSYMGHHTDRQMREYYTTERTVEFLQRCEQAGITTHQASSRHDYLSLLRERGSKLQIICLDSEQEKIKETIKIAQPIAMVHHGGVTDRLFAEGNSKLVHNYVKAVKDCGLMAGVSAHNPNVIKQIANEGWEIDFFMTCFYFLTRNLEKKETMPIIPVGSYNFFKDDPQVMTQVIRQVKQPCLAFKILGAGRLCSSEEKVRAAFQFAFENIKPTDGVIVGMFPWFFDEIGANVQYAQEFGI